MIQQALCQQYVMTQGLTYATFTAFLFAYPTPYFASSQSCSHTYERPLATHLAISYVRRPCLPLIC